MYEEKPPVDRGAIFTQNTKHKHPSAPLRVILIGTIF